MESLRNILPALTSLAEHAARREGLPPAAAAALAWQLAAGPDLSLRAEFHACTGGVLLLRATDAATRAQITSIEPEILRAFNSMLPTASYPTTDLGAAGGADQREASGRSPGKYRLCLCRRIQFLP